MSIRSYSELKDISGFKERFEYLQLNGAVSAETFGWDRYLNQFFYRSIEWKKARNQVIIRDNGCDLGVEGREILGRVYIHHMNPIRPEDIENRTDFLLNPEYLITVSFDTHQAIHFGDFSLIPGDPIQRSKNDTCLWRK